MAINSSAETIREMEQTLKSAVKQIEGIKNYIMAAKNTTANWTDAQGQQYKELMGKISNLTDSPAETLNSAIPRLEKLAQSLDDYGKIKF